MWCMYSLSEYMVSPYEYGDGDDVLLLFRRDGCDLLGFGILPVVADVALMMATAFPPARPDDGHEEGLKSAAPTEFL